MKYNNILIAPTLLLLATLTIGCSTLAPTPYTPQDASGYGYKIEKKDNIQVAQFYGNKDTQPVRAYAYAVLSAYDACAKKNQLALVSHSVDQSKEVNYTEVYSNTNYYMTPRGHYVPYVTTNSYPVTLTFPKYAVAFECREHLHSLSGSPRTQNISRELVGPITKDFKGGVLLAFDRSEEKPVAVTDDDLVIAIGTQRVETSAEFYEQIDKTKPGPAALKVIRNNVITAVKTEVIDTTDSLREVETKSVDLLCNAVGAEVDVFKGIPSGEKAKAENEIHPKHKNLSEAEKLDEKSAEELCARLRGMAFLKKKNLL